MSPTNPHIISQLRQLIYYHLDCNLLRNALFLAGRLHAYEPRSSEAAYLLALCHLRLGQLKAAYDASRISGSRGTHIGCSYVFAQACLGLERYVEGVTATDRSRTSWSPRSNWNKHTDTRRQHLPDAAAFHCLQGKLWHAHHDTNKAIECYAEALKLNPFMWDAFLGLCDLGVNVRIPNIFKMTPEMTSALANSSFEEKTLGISEDPQPPSGLSQAQVNNSSINPLPSNNDPFSISKNRINSEVRLNVGSSALFERINSEVRLNVGSSALFEKYNGSRSIVTPIGGGGGGGFQGLDTPTGHPGGSNAETLDKDVSGAITIPISIEPPLAPMRKARTLQGMGMDFSNDVPPKMRSNSIKSKSRTKTESEDPDNFVTSKISTLNTGVGERKRTVSGQPPQLSTATSSVDPTANSSDPMAPQRRSVRLFNQIRPQSGKFSTAASSMGAKEGRELKKAKATGTKGRSANSFNVGRVVSGNRKHGDSIEIDAKEQRPLTSVPSGAPTAHPKPAVNDKVKEYESLQWLLDLFTKLGGGYFLLSHYQCQEAIQTFNSITPSQRDTPWVLAQIGHALYEQRSYAEAEKFFSRVRTMAPARLEDMEVYSTILWHLKSEIDLAFLAHEIIEIDRESPQAWCAVGNSFSLKREHDEALKCFKRATQLDPKFAYAFALQGHEHVFNEEYDKALAAYRNSIAAENRHYHAWYGLGHVFEKQGKYSFAEQHYRTAANINPTNTYLFHHIGVVLEKMKNPKAALVYYTRSIEMAPDAANSRLKKAKILLFLQEPHKALFELNICKDLAPDDADVHFSLGKTYKVLRQKNSAIKHFTIALNLDPKASHLIKEAMEQMEDVSDEEDGDMHPM